MNTTTHPAGDAEVEFAAAVEAENSHSAKRIEELEREVVRLTHRLQTVADESCIGGPQECQSAEDNITRIEHIIADALQEIAYQRAEVARLRAEAKSLKIQLNHYWQSHDYAEEMVKERDQWRECAEKLALRVNNMRCVLFQEDADALAEFDRLKGDSK